MATKDFGKISIASKGVWTTQTTDVEKNDIWKYGVSKFLALVNNPTVAPNDDGINWCQMSTAGESAYQEAVKLGFIGTEADWIKSLSAESLPDTEEQGFFIADANNNVVAKYDNDGFDVAKISTHLKSLLLNSIFPNWTGIKVFFIGDSITSSNTSLEFYHQYLHNWTGITVYNGGVSGDKLTGGMASRITNATIDVDVVVVFGGTNDWGASVALGDPITSLANDGTVCGAVKNIISCHLSRNPYKKLLFFSPIPRATSYGNIGMNNSAGYSLGDLVTAIKTVCHNFGVPFLDQYNECLLKPWVSIENTYYFNNSDGLHPNDKGHKIMACAMLEFMKKYIIDNNM